MTYMIFQSAQQGLREMHEHLRKGTGTEDWNGHLSKYMMKLWQIERNMQQINSKIVKEKVKKRQVNNRAMQM